MKWMLLLVLLSGCGPNADALVGSWKYLNLKEVYSFSADHSVRVDTDGPGPGPGCNVHRIVSGSWMTDGDKLTITTTSATTQTSMCFDTNQNTLQEDDPNAVLGTSTFTWAVNGNMLTLTNSQGNVISFTRQ